MSDSALAVSALSHAMRGNQNKAPGRPFSDTLRTVLFTDSKKRMTAVVHALVTKAEEGDIPAIKEIADRIEGKVALQIQSNSTLTVIDADLLREAGALLQYIGTNLPAPLEIVDSGASEDVNATVGEQLLTVFKEEADHGRND